jgi:Bacterial protein of unknown function (Gcw_chp)
MKKSILNTILLLLIAAWTACPVSVKAGEAYIASHKEPVTAEEEEESWWSASLSFAWDSQYMFRGVDVLGGDDLIHTTLEFEAHGFNLGVWFAEGLNADYNELNVFLGYTHSLGPVDLSGGYIYYRFPKSGDVDTHELYLGIAYTGLKYITPSLYYYHDVDVIDAGYLEFKLSSSIPLYRDIITLEPYALIAAGDYNKALVLGAEDSDWDWNHVQAGVAVSFALNEHITLAVHGDYSHALDAIEGAFPGTNDDEWWTGASITFAF